RTLPAVNGAATSLALPGYPTRRELVHLAGDHPGEVLSGVDVVFPMLHGAFGEDGTIQGLLEMAGVPYVGAGVLASATAMDKEFAKKLLAAEGLPVGDLVVLRPGTATLTPQERDRLGLPVFVKPARAGSSVGITRVADWADLDAAIAHAREHDPKVLVEAAVAGREVECAVLEFPDGSVRASVPAEIRIVGVGPDGTTPEFYDFAAKYLDDVCEFDIPAKLDDAVSERLRDLAVAAFRAVDGQGLARVDFFVGPEGELTLNEVNTMPGFTPISMYPRAWAVTGIDFETLLTTLVETAIARGTGLR
ncbi:MAG: D-alanine--D-alanine ligase family protein, partial [Pseudonocardia sp.]